MKQLKMNLIFEEYDIKVEQTKIIQQKNRIKWKIATIYSELPEKYKREFDLIYNIELNINKNRNIYQRKQEYTNKQDYIKKLYEMFYQSLKV